MITGYQLQLELLGSVKQQERTEHRSAYRKGVRGSITHFSLSYWGV